MVITNSLAKKSQAGTFGSYITNDGIKKRINEVIGGKDGQAFITSIISAVTNNPVLSECEHATILSAAMIGASLKLSPSPQLGQYYLVPYNDKKNGRKVATFQIGYKGYIQLAIRSGYYKKINVVAVKEGELVKFDHMNEDIEVNIIEDDEVRENAATIGYYAMFEYLNGFRKALYWSKKKMLKHADTYSMAYQSDKKYNSSRSFWTKDFDSMAFKTLLRQLISKWGIMSVELQSAYAEDNTGLKTVETAEYVGDAPEKDAAADIFGEEAKIVQPSDVEENPDGSVKAKEAK